MNDALQAAGQGFRMTGRGIRGADSGEGISCPRFRCPRLGRRYSGPTAARSRPFAWLIAAILTVPSVPACGADGYGSISGQFLFEGEVPEPVLVIRKNDPAVRDAAVCATEDHYDGALQVDPETKGIRDVFVYLLRAPDVHSDLKESREKEVVFDQKNCRFIPRSLFVRTDQKVRVVSDDPVPHNTRTNTFRNQPVNFNLAPNDRKGTLVSVPVPERLPMPVNCDYHKWMRANWLILDHPYAAITDAKGKFKIEKLPAGTHQFIVWHEKTGYIDRQYEVTVETDQKTTLEAVKVPATKFQRAQ